MKKYPRIILVLSLILVLTAAGCVSIQVQKTHIDNVGEIYTAVPITRPFFGEKYIIDEYTFVRKSTSTRTREGFGGISEESITKCVFYKDKAKLRNIAIIRRNKGTRIGANIIKYSESRLFVRVNGTEYEVSVGGGYDMSNIGDYFRDAATLKDHIEPELLFQIQDKSAGEISVNRYYRVNSKTPEKESVSGSGLTILVDGSELGIVAFDPLGFYLRNESKDRYESNKEALIFYMLAAYVVTRV